MGRNYHHPMPRVPKRSWNLVYQCVSLLARGSAQRSTFPTAGAAFAAPVPSSSRKQRSTSASFMTACLGKPVITAASRTGLDASLATAFTVLSRQISSCLTPDPYFANTSPATSVMLYPANFLRMHLRKMGVSPGHAFWSFLAAKGAMFRCMCFGTALRSVEYGIDMTLSQPLSAVPDMVGQATGETGAIVAGSMSELVAQAVTYPQSTLTHICANCAETSTGGATQVKKVIFQHMFSAGSLKKLYTGLGCHLVYSMPCFLLKFAACEAMAYAYLKE